MTGKVRSAISTWRTDAIFRANASIYASLAIIIGYAIFEAISGYVLKSEWMGTLAFYYIVLSSMRFFILRRINQTGSDEQWRAYRTCGLVMFLLTIALAGLHILNIRQYHTIEYPGYVIYAVAVHTFYMAVSAIRYMIVYRGTTVPLLAASRAINLAVASISMYNLQSAMISAFGENDELFRVTMSNCACVGVIALIAAMSVHMIAKANRRL